MNGELNKNSPEELKRLRRYLVLSGVIVKQEEMEDLNEWITMVEEEMKKSEDRIKEKI